MYIYMAIYVDIYVFDDGNKDGDNDDAKHISPIYQIRRGCSWLFLATPNCSRLLEAAPGSSWLSLAAWLLGCWRPLPDSSRASA